MPGTRDDPRMQKLKNGFATLLKKDSLFMEQLNNHIIKEFDLLAERVLVKQVIYLKMQRGGHNFKNGNLVKAAQARLDTKEKQVDPKEVIGWSEDQLIQWFRQLNGGSLDEEQEKHVKRIHGVFSYIKSRYGGDLTKYKDDLLKIENNEDVTFEGSKNKKVDVLFVDAHKSRQMILRNLGEWSFIPIDSRVSNFLFRTGILATYYDEMFKGKETEFIPSLLFKFVVRKFAEEHLQGLKITLNGVERDLSDPDYIGLLDKVLFAFGSGADDFEKKGHCQTSPACKEARLGLSGCPFKDGCRFYSIFHHRASVGK
jgi:hypothetical protein